MTARPSAVALALVLAITTLDACRKKPEPEPTPVQTTTTTSDAGASQRRADSIAAAQAAQRRADSIASARMGATNGADAERLRTEIVTSLSQRVYFDYDQDVLRDDTRAALDAKAAILTANPAVTLVVTGHTDERGTAEYNLALGQRRAAQVKRYLVSKGIAENRIATQSLGDSQPASQGTDESSYQQNRRAEFEAMNVTGALVRPRQ
jgi:peptidoglycan-associated lipoprotein